MTTMTDGIFVTSDGVRLVLDPGHRASVRPADGGGYASGLERIEEPSAIERHLQSVDRRVVLAENLLALHGHSMSGRDVLLVGAADGAEAVCLLRRGASSVTGIDFGEHFTPESAALRERFVRAHTGASARVRFMHDDIASSGLEGDRFGLIMSWQTLEHVLDVEACMGESVRLLTAGGGVYHEYNPFFSIDGGHALVTLDMAWGHAQLREADLKRYLHERRPEEAERAISFYETALNGLSQSLVRESIDRSGLQTNAWLPRFRAEDALLLTPEIFDRVRSVHPGIVASDLVSRIVRCVLTKA